MATREGRNPSGFKSPPKKSLGPEWSVWWVSSLWCNSVWSWLWTYLESAAEPNLRRPMQLWPNASRDWPNKCPPAPWPSSKLTRRLAGRLCTRPGFFPFSFIFFSESYTGPSSLVLYDESECSGVVACIRRRVEVQAGNEVQMDSIHTHARYIASFIPVVLVFLHLQSRSSLLTTCFRGTHGNWI